MKRPLVPVRRTGTKGPPASSGDSGPRGDPLPEPGLALVPNG